MITRAHVALLLVAGTLSTATSLDAHAQDRAGVARHISTFGLEVFRHVASAASGPNVVFSPLSAGLATALLAEGSERETRAELHAALGSSNDGWQQYQRGIHALLTDLNADTTTLTRIASSLWADEGRVLRPGFVESAERLHLATSERGPASGATADVVNGWAKERPTAAYQRDATADRIWP
jgi:serine protease inhibitor